MDKQTVTVVVSVALGVFTIIGTILPSVFWSHGRLSDQITAIEARLDDIDNRLVAVETTLAGDYFGTIDGMSKPGYQ